MEKRKDRRSLRTKLVRAALIALLLLSVIVGSISGAVVSKLANEDSAKLMMRICGEEALRFDNKLGLVSHSVDMIYEYADMLIEHSEYELYSDAYTEAVKELALSVANKTDGAMAVYFRYDPQIFGNGTGGFFWSRKTDGSGFIEEPPTDILAYSSSDVEHVGWFYEPKKKEEPLWMAPYYNRNINVSMISYIIPFYLRSGEFVGVIGIDIDFCSIMATAGSVQLYETGKLALIDLGERLVYYADGADGLREERLSSKLYNHVTTINKTTDILEITDEENRISLSCCRRLSNSMILYVSVPKQEVYDNRDNMIVLLAICTLLIMTATFFSILRYTEQIIGPIKRLAEITRSYANGDWEESYHCDSGDEIEELSESISTMAGNTQSYIARIKSIATTDALTGVGNTTAYVRYIDRIPDNRNEKFSAYSVTVMDLNLLKKANDNYGHEAGDALIREASRYICTRFSHSAVFRIGGDEFAVISLGEDHAAIGEICRKFEQDMQYPVKDAHDIPLSIAFGTASFPQDADNYDALFKIADGKMYEKKKQMKMCRES